jgi:hypothetical protein
MGMSGLTASDYVDVEQRAQVRQLGVIAAGIFSITAALARHFALIASLRRSSGEHQIPPKDVDPTLFHLFAIQIEIMIG